MIRRICIAILLLSAAGCSGKTETGYEPRHLGMNESQRRALYASPFTPEAHAAQEEAMKRSGPTPRLGG